MHCNKLNSRISEKIFLQKATKETKGVGTVSEQWSRSLFVSFVTFCQILFFGCGSAALGLLRFFAAILRSCPGCLRFKIPLFGGGSPRYVPLRQFVFGPARRGSSFE